MGTSTGASSAHSALAEAPTNRVDKSAEKCDDKSRYNGVPGRIRAFEKGRAVNGENKAAGWTELTKRHKMGLRRTPAPDSRPDPPWHRSSSRRVSRWKSPILPPIHRPVASGQKREVSRSRLPGIETAGQIGLPGSRIHLPEQCPARWSVGPRPESLQGSASAQRGAGL